MKAGDLHSEPFSKHLTDKFYNEALIIDSQQVPAIGWGIVGISGWSRCWNK